MPLTAKQQKLPPALKKAILAKQAAPKKPPQMAKLKTPVPKGRMPQTKPKYKK